MQGTHTHVKGAACHQGKVLEHRVVLEPCNHLRRRQQPIQNHVFNSAKAVLICCRASSATVFSLPADSSRASQAQYEAPARVSSRQPDYKMVASGPDLIEMLEELQSATCVALDCEGVKLGDRQSGKLTLMQLSARMTSGGRTSLRIWIVDVLALQPRTFNYHTADGSLSLRKLLEDERVCKLMFDVRSDSSQLWHQFSIRLRSAYDLQLAEVAVRQLQMIPTMYVLPLDKVLSTYITPRTQAFQEDMAASYEIARAYHYSNKTEVWEQRPLSAELLGYASCDVRYLHQLADALNMKLPSSIVDKVKQGSSSRVASPVSADKRRAEAPIIVRRSDVFKLINNKQPPSQPGQPEAVQPNSHTGPAEGRRTGALSQNGNGPQQAARTRHNQSTNQEPIPSAPTRRELPRRLPLGQPGVAQEPGTNGADDRVAEQGEAPQGRPAPFLLQPRKRAEGEEAPTWIYDSLKPPEPASDEEQPEADSGDGQMPSPEEQGMNGADGLQEQTESPSQLLSENLLLWRPASVSTGSSQPGLKRPTLQRPPSRQ